MLGGQGAITLATPRERASITVDWTTTTGVRFPDGVQCVLPPTEDDAVVYTSSAALGASQFHRVALVAAAEHAVATAALATIEREYRATRLRARALSKHWLPRLRDELARINLELEEQDRAESSRLRLVQLGYGAGATPPTGGQREHPSLSLNRWRPATCGMRLPLRRTTTTNPRCSLRPSSRLPLNCSRVGRIRPGSRVRHRNRPTRHSAAAKRRSHGRDRSFAAMLARLREKIGEDELPAVVGDMATTRVAGEFRLVFVAFNSISNLRTQAEQVACFGNAARHLAVGGHFVVELFVPPLRRLVPGQRAVPFAVGEDFAGVDVIDVTTQTGTSHHYLHGPNGTVRHFVNNFRYIWPSECDLMAQLAGLDLVARYGDWDRSAFTADSDKHVSVWQKARA